MKDSGFSLLLLFGLSLFTACVNTTSLVNDHASYSQHPEPIVITDSSGAQINIPHPATKIVSLNERATELLIAIGVSDRIVGVDDSSVKNPLFAGKLTQASDVGNAFTPDVEAILALKPDVVIGYSTAKPHNLDKIIAANLTMTYIDSYRLSNLSGDALMLGQITGNTGNATMYSQFVNNNIDLVTSRLSSQNLIPPRVYFEAYSDYSVMTPRSAGGQILDQLGCRNVYGNTDMDWVTISPEWIVNQNPDIILKIAANPKSSGESLEHVYDRIVNRTGYSTMKAVQDKRVYVINADLASGPRADIGFLYIAKAVYPDLFSDVEPDAALHTYANRFFSGADQIETYYPPMTEERT